MLYQATKNDHRLTKEVILQQYQRYLSDAVKKADDFGCARWCVFIRWC